jgi:hypothetical protein
MVMRQGKKLILGHRKTALHRQTKVKPPALCIRNYIYVSDLARAHSDALRHLRSRAPSLTLNFATSHRFSMLEVIGSVKRVSGFGSRSRLHRGARADRKIVAVAQQARATLGWHPRFEDPFDDRRARARLGAHADEAPRKCAESRQGTRGCRHVLNASRSAPRACRPAVGMPSHIGEGVLSCSFAGPSDILRWPGGEAMKSWLMIRIALAFIWLAAIACSTAAESGLGLRAPNFDPSKGSDILRHRGPTGKPCLAVSGSPRRHAVITNLYDHVITVQNSCAQRISMKVCYYNSQDCLSIEIPGGERKEVILGTLSSADFRFEFREKF